MYNVRVCFAHGVEFEFANVEQEQTTLVRNWLNPHIQNEAMLQAKFEGNEYILNRDYVCAVVIEEVG